MMRAFALPAAALLLLLLAHPAPAYTGMPAGTENPPQENPAFEQELVELINAARASEGKSPLKRIDCLNRGTRYHAIDMRDDGYFSHDTYDAGAVYICGLFDRVEQFYAGFVAGGETIGAGYASPQQMVDAWLASPPHHDVIMYSGFREIGSGFCTGGTNWRYWVVDYALHPASYPIVINSEADSTESPAVSLYIHGAGVWDEMRLRNDGEDWGEWVSFASTLDWELRPEAGMREVWAQMRNESTSTESSDTIALDMSSDVTPAPQAWAASVRLEPGHPNPFHSAVTITYSLPAEGAVDLRVHDASGRVIRLLREGIQGAGEHWVTWDGTDNGGRAMPAGTYFTVLRTPTARKQGTLILVR